VTNINPTIQERSNTQYEEYEGEEYAERFAHMVA
jgi:hypothetical protein